jgi:acyl transferase domain-containing protein/acyl carrier protein
MSRETETRAQLNRALAALEQMRARLVAAESKATESIAVVGIGCRFPGGVDSPETFWELLREGRDGIVPPPTTRPELAGHVAGRPGGYLEQVNGFDAPFFGMSPAEALRADPQQRLLLEVTWEALEHAGISPMSLAGSPTGVFVGMGSHNSDYAFRQFGRSGSDLNTVAGTFHGLTAGRLAYFLGLRGPSLALDAACAASLVAVHLACRSLLTGECRVALAAGVNLILGPGVSGALNAAGMLAADGRCRSFDAAASGMGRGEGCGVVVLKRLGDALKEGDRVLAIIRGSAVNQSGGGNGLVSPNGRGQQDVMLQALAAAQVKPEQVGYVETHGTGTPLGDTVEAEAIAETLRPKGGKPLLLGSTKANLGHLEAASGVAGLIRAVLVLQHRTIPGHPHFRTPHPHLATWSDRLRIPTVATPWEQPQGPRIVGVSAFGMSGTNAHVILEEAPAAMPSPMPDHPGVLCLSAKSSVALRELTERYRRFLANPEPELTLAEVCYTAAISRHHFSHRLALVAGSLTELVDQLARPAPQPRPEFVKLQAVADRYARGESIDWHDVFPTPCRRVTLPRYPFQREAYWIPDEPWFLNPSHLAGTSECMQREKPGEGESQQNILSPRDTDVRRLSPSRGWCEDSLHRHATLNWAWEVVWRPAPVYPKTRLPVGRWVLFADAEGIAESLVAELRAEGSECLLVDTQRAGNVARVLSEYGRCDFAVYLWGVGTGCDPGVRLDTATAGLLHFVQTATRSAAYTPRLWVITRQGQSVLPGEVVDPVGAAIVGMGRVLAVEHPEFRTVLLDLEATENHGHALTTLLGEPHGEGQIAVREGRRFVPRLVSVKLPPSQASAPIRKGGSYLITGGLGGVGLHVARWLAAWGAGSLTLCGRRPPSSDAVSVIREIEKTGVTVRVVSADVIRPDDVARLLGAIPGRELHGVVHAAGVRADGLLGRQPWEEFRDTLAAKSLGAWNLHVALGSAPLDFFVLFSSTASLVGMIGSGAYAAANAFLDGLAHLRRANGLAALSINWGAWEGIGMAHDPEGRHTATWRKHGLEPFPAEDGLKRFSELLSVSTAQIVATPADWTKYASLFPDGRVPAFLSEVTGSGATASNLSLQNHSAAFWLERATVHVRRLIGITGELDANTPLRDLGLDSMAAVELRNALSRDAARPLPATLVFNHPTLAAIAAFLAEVPVKAPSTPPRVTELAGMSEKEAEELLVRKLASLKPGGTR